jgi:hypothetical protein
VVGEKNVADANFRGGLKGLMLGHVSGYSGRPGPSRPCSGGFPEQKRRPLRPPFKELKSSNSLDQVDLSRKIRGNFQTNFLFANFGLRPDFHGVSSWYSDRLLLLLSDLVW